MRERKSPRDGGGLAPGDRGHTCQNSNEDRKEDVSFIFVMTNNEHNALVQEEVKFFVAQGIKPKHNGDFVLVIGKAVHAWKDMLAGLRSSQHQGFRI